MDVLIVGGGIGGLSAALALHHAGHQVTLVERAPRFAPVGAGIVLAPNATAVLAALGVDLAGRGHPLPFFEVTRADGTVLQRIAPQRMSDRYGPTYALSRPDLHAALLDAMPAEVQLRQGQALTSLRQTDQSVAVTLAEETTPRTFDMVVGADGLHSTIRTLVLGPQPLRYSGVTCWRGITRNPGYQGAVESWGSGTRIGMVPLRDDQVYYYLVRTAPRRAPELDWPDGFRHAFASQGDDLARLLSVLTEAPPLHHDLDELDTPVWGRGRVLLLGDAAHAMTPNQGQGAAMAIEDAYALMVALRDGADDAVQRYAALRHRRVRAVQLTSRRLGQVSHWTGPLARAARDALMRSLPTSVADDQYRRLIQPAFDLLPA